MNPVATAAIHLQIPIVVSASRKLGQTTNSAPSAMVELCGRRLPPDRRPELNSSALELDSSALKLDFTRSVLDSMALKLNSPGTAGRARHHQRRR
jgi:hypothetical protein